MSIEIIFENDDVIIDGVSQKTKQVVTSSRASSFIDMEHAPKAAPTPITPVPIAGVVNTEDDSVESYIDDMIKRSSAKYTANGSFASESFSSALNVMAEDDEVEEKKEEEIIDIEEDEMTPVEPVVIDESVIPNDAATATAEVLADKYKGDIKDLDEHEDNEEHKNDDADVNYVTRREFDVLAISLYNKFDEIEKAVKAISEKVDKLTTGLDDINAEYNKDAAKINENFSIIEVDSKGLREKIEGIEYVQYDLSAKFSEIEDKIASLNNTLATADVNKNDIIKEAVKKIVPAIFKHLPEIINEQLQKSEGESEPNIPDETPMEDPVVISESDAAALTSDTDTVVEVNLSDNDIQLNKYDEEEKEKAEIIREAAEKGHLFPWITKPGDTTPNPEKQEYKSSTFAPPQPRKKDSDWGKEERSFRDYVDDNFVPEEDDDDSMTIKTSSVITNNTPAGYYDPAKAARARKYANKQNKKKYNNDYNGGGKHHNNKKNNKNYR